MVYDENNQYESSELIWVRYIFYYLLGFLSDLELKNSSMWSLEQ